MTDNAIDKTVLPHGSWPSPLTARRIAEGGTQLIDLAMDEGKVYWLEARPAEGGRCVLVRLDGDKPVDVTPTGFSVRSRVHEYGGQSFVIDRGTIWFCNDADQRIYRQQPGREPEPLTPPGPMRYAGLVVDRRRDRLLCVREDHGGGGEPVNALVAIDRHGGESRLLWQGSDFVDSPSLSDDGDRLAWIAWDHPDLPWDETALWVAEIDGDGGLNSPWRLNPGRSESVLEPRWARDGSLYCLSDHRGWWNPHRWRGQGIEPVLTMPAEFTRAPWQVAQSSYRLLPGDEALVTWLDQGRQRLGRLRLDSGHLEPIDLPHVGIASLAVDAGGKRACFLGGHADSGPCVVAIDLADGHWQELHRAQAVDLAAADIARAQPFRFATSNAEHAHAFFYPPTRARCRGPDGERPMAIVVIHGGPTSQTSVAFKPALQFWTQRGFAIIDVDYRGSSGYGRDYRHRLRGQWGVLDVDDAVHAAHHAVEQGWVDGRRLIIRGGSAGGYTVLAALAMHDTFAAGANYYGVSDVEALAKDTHKFEARYLDRLIGPYPQERRRYVERSPIHHLDRFDRPLIVLQGLEDKVVPPAQSEAIVRALRQRGVPVAYLAFAGEQHGFRRAENQIRALEAELYFYGRVFGFVPADAIEPVPIEDLA